MPCLFPSSRRERHAKTLDIAQEEVLTCLGIHLYERLYRIQQTVRDEEQTWQILLFRFFRLVIICIANASHEVEDTQICLSELPRPRDRQKRS